MIVPGHGPKNVAGKEPVSGHRAGCVEVRSPGAPEPSGHLARARVIAGLMIGRLILSV